MAVECNADLGHPCDADDGEPCPSCREEAAYWEGLYARTPASMRRLEAPTQKDLEERDRDLVEAGRGHLLG